MTEGNYLILTVLIYIGHFQLFICDLGLKIHPPLFKLSKATLFLKRTGLFATLYLFMP